MNWCATTRSAHFGSKSGFTVWASPISAASSEGKKDLTCGGVALLSGPVLHSSRGRAVLSYLTGAGNCPSSVVAGCRFRLVAALWVFFGWGLSDTALGRGSTFHMQICSFSLFAFASSHLSGATAMLTTKRVFAGQGTVSSLAR